MALSEKGGDVMVIYTRSITLRNGRVLRASQCNLKAFRFEVSEEEYKRYMEKKRKKVNS